jgi:hypothetical protein
MQRMLLIDWWSVGKAYLNWLPILPSPHLSPLLSPHLHTNPQPCTCIRHSCPHTVINGSHCWQRRCCRVHPENDIFVSLLPSVCASTWCWSPLASDADAPNVAFTLGLNDQCLSLTWRGYRWPGRVSLLVLACHLMSAGRVAFNHWMHLLLLTR